jgi:hypothetical protein
MQEFRPPVVAESAPGSQCVTEFGGGQMLNGRKTAQEITVFRDCPVNLRLLQH